MFGKKCEGKKKMRGVKVALGVLAMVGAVSVVKESKRWISDKCRKLTGMMKPGTEDAEG